MRREEFTDRPLAPRAAARARRPALSVVVPLYDEEAVVPELVARLSRVLDALGVEAEVLLIDDGSRDGTWRAIRRARAADPRIVGLALSRNFGHQAAISAGLAHARGRAVVVMDGDLQDPPEAIAPLWAKLHEGFDVVYAVRARRPEGPLKRLAYRVFYRLLRRLGAIDLPLDAGDFSIMSRRVVGHLNAMPERRRFVRGLRAWVGFRQTGLPIDRAPRHAGRSKYTAGRLLSLALDGLVGFSPVPVRLAGVLGAAAVTLAALGLAVGALRTLVTEARPDATVWIGLGLLFFGGAQLLFLAVLGEYVGRIFDQVNERPLYLVRRRIGFPTDRRRQPRTTRTAA